MSKLTEIEKLCLHLEEANPDLFESNKLTEADKAFYELLINPAIKLDSKHGFEIEDLIANALSETKKVYFVAGYIMAHGLNTDLAERSERMAVI